MIRTNLSTRPFYNARAVNLLIGVFAFIVLGLTAYNAAQLIRLTSSQRTLGSNASRAENEADRLRREAVQTLARVDKKELATVDKAAREANAIIDQRTFSWTDLLGRFERTLPADVRVTSVSQQAGREVVLIDTEARTVEDVDQFIEALEKTGAFRDVIARTETVMENDLIAASIQATYVRAGAPAEAQQ
ncbi:MAG TPA: PilN domain-containing protein [Vicinamibacterales bacterium]|nr:PilN domain-containing protein [Vicinamibacterales bacterium]